MDLTVEKNNLLACLDKRDTDKFKIHLKVLYEKSNPEEKKAISSFVKSELKKSTNRIKNTINNVQIGMQSGSDISKRIGSIAIYS